MKIMRYGVTLQRVGAENLEMLRQWRNDPRIRQHMFFRADITPAMQQEWFHSIDNPANFFFVIYYKDRPAGLINISSIDWERKTAYSGLFIYEEGLQGSDVPVRASLAMLDVFLLLLGIRQIFAKVKGDNLVAHRYNLALGFVRTKKIELGQGYEYVLELEQYTERAGALRRAAERTWGNETVIDWAGNDDTDRQMRHRLQAADPEQLHQLQVRVT